MKRVAKPEGKFNIVIEEVAMPKPSPGEVRIKAVRSLISRGSEMGGGIPANMRLTRKVWGTHLLESLML